MTTRRTRTDCTTYLELLYTLEREYRRINIVFTLMGSFFAVVRIMVITSPSSKRAGHGSFLMTTMSTRCPKVISPNTLVIPPLAPPMYSIIKPPTSIYRPLDYITPHQRRPEMSEQALSPAGSIEASPALPINPPLPPGLAEEGDSSDISDPPFPVTPSQSSSPLLHPTDKKSSRQTIDVKVSVSDEASSPPSPVHCVLPCDYPHYLQ